MFRSGQITEWQKVKSGLLSTSEMSSYKAEITAAFQGAAFPQDRLRGTTLGHTPNRSHNHTTVLQPHTSQPVFFGQATDAQHNWQDLDPGYTALTAAGS